MHLTLLPQPLCGLFRRQVPLSREQGKHVRMISLPTRPASKEKRDDKALGIGGTHLRFGHHLEPDQKFPHAAATQERGVEVDVEVRRVRGFRGVLSWERGQGRLMDPHRVREGSAEGTAEVRR